LSSAFFPNGAEDQEKDVAFEKEVEHISKRISMDDEEIQINRKYRAQEPWPLAQDELQRINIYKAPVDKLHCIIQACKTLMSLLFSFKKKKKKKFLWFLFVFFFFFKNIHRFDNFE